MKLSRNLLFFIIFIISTYLIAFAKSKDFNISRFIAADTCWGCHDTIYRQWNKSMHGLAHKDPVYLKVALFLLKGLTDKDELKEAEICVKCHTPIGFFSGYPKKLSDDQKKIPEIAKNGVQCDFCHSATHSEKTFNNKMVLDPGHGEKDPGTKRGPFKDSESEFHKTQFSEFHTSSKICGTCHNVRHVVFGTKLENTYDEWENSPYNSKDPEKLVTCQGCHMYQRPGFPGTGSTKRVKNPGKAADFGPFRDHIFTHYFVGGNRFVPSLFNDTLRDKMVEDRLKNAAELTVDTTQVKSNKLIINIKNTGAGHYLPTGLTNVRQMWLEITVKDRKGKIIFQSGKLDKDGYLPDNTIIYNTVFGDGDGKPVLNVSKARKIIKDRRIPPLESLKETIKLPNNNYKSININVRLLYRSLPQKILDLVTKKGKHKLPVTVMNRIKKTVVVK